MTASDPRVGEIQARVRELQGDRAKAAMWRTTDIAYLLAELQKAREALARMDAAAGRVEGLCLYWDGLADGDRYYASQVRAAVSAAAGGGE